MRRLLTVSIFMAGATQVHAEEYLEKVESPVYETSGDVAALTGRAATCAAEKLKSGFATAPTVIANDLQGGVVVANNYFKFVDSFSTPEARSKVRIEARVDRFRIVHTDIEIFNKSWRPVPSLKEGKRDPLKEQLQAISDELATCVRAAATPADW